MPRRRGVMFSEADLHPTHPVTVGEQVEIQHGIKLEDFRHGKVHLNPKKFPPGSRRAQKVMLKKTYLPNRARTQVRLNRLMAENGLPVLKTGLVVAPDGTHYFAVEPFVRGKKSVLTPVNIVWAQHEPFFLSNFNTKEHGQLIRDLARDVATIHNLGITTKFFDYHGFYVKNGKYHRRIMDINRFMPCEDPALLKRDIRFTLGHVSEIWSPGSEEYELFEETLKDKLKGGLKDYE